MLKSMRVHGPAVDEIAQQQSRDLQVVQQQERQRVVAVEDGVLAGRDHAQAVRRVPRLGRMRHSSWYSQ